MEKTTVVILAAGRGTRMKSPLQKVLHPVGGRAMITHTVDAAHALHPEKVIVVVGHQREEVGAALAGRKVTLAVQDQPRGTGDAVARTAPLLRDYAHEVLIMCGDTPLLRPATLRALLAAHRAAGAAATVMTTRLTEPAGYGRISRNGRGDLERIIEESDADPAQRRIDEVNSGVYVFAAGRLFDCLEKIRPDNAKGEYYLTDVIGILRDAGERVAAFRAEQPEEVLGINTREELARADRLHAARAAADAAGTDNG